MNIANLLGQLFVVGLSRPTLDEETRKFLTTFCPGGVILFPHNAPDPQTLLTLCRDLHALPSPPLITIDHEGGRVQRLTAPFTHFPAAAHLGATSSPFLAGRGKVPGYGRTGRYQEPTFSWFFPGSNRVFSQ